ncbi:MAG: sugar transferase [Clostridiales bacterium]|nr:sugar transferase [Clostridiales bacterium]
MIGKRIFDIFFSLLAILIFLTPGIIISILVVLSSKGGIFYLQKRIGKNAKEFGIMKFRTMHKNADKKGLLTIGNKDPRVTKFGRFLRKSKLDELPQFINILIGQMSFVGPRPEASIYVKRYNEEQRKILQIKPGLTDFASIEYFNENEILAKFDDPETAYLEKIMPEKILLNLQYINKMNIFTDIGILFKTLFKIIGL